MPKLRFLCFLLVLLLPFSSSAQNLNDELLAATRKSDVEKVRALLAKGADVNAKSPYGATPLFFACDRSNIEVVTVLLISYSSNVEAVRGCNKRLTDFFFGRFQSAFFSAASRS